MTLTERFHAISQDMELWQKFYNKHQQEYLRKRLKAIRLLWEGKSRPEVCKILGCSYFALSQWVEIYVAEMDEDRLSRLIKKENITPTNGGKQGRRTRRKVSHLVKMENITPTYRSLFNITWVEEKNRPSFLTEEQQAELKKSILAKKPADVGLEKNIWTAELIARHVEKEYGVTYKPISIYDVLDRLNLSHQKAHADYAEADPDKQKAFVEEVLKKIENLQAGEKIVAFDEFAAYDRPSLYYGWAEKNTTFKIPVRQAKKRQRLNGLLAVDLLSGEEFLRFSPKSKSEDLADFFIDLAQDVKIDGFSKLSVFLDNVSTHYKMPRLLREALREKQVGVEVDFLYTATYSPKLNPAEYVIHKIRQEFFHHLPDNASWNDINETIACHLDDNRLVDQQQMANIIRHIYELVE